MPTYRWVEDVWPWIAAAFSMGGVFLNTRKSCWCWPLFIVGCIIWMYVFFFTQRWAEFTLFTSYLFLNSYGWVKWSRDKKKNPA